MTKAMAADFGEVIGVDVSDGMLQVARAHIAESNVELRLGDGLNLPVETSTAEAAFSAHVFQHLDSLTLAHANFSEIARVLRPGATMMVHLPVVMPPAGIPGVLSLVAARNRVDDVRATLRRWRRAPLMRWLQYPWPWLVRELPALGLVDVELAVFVSAGSGIHHACVLARRSATAS
jgi:ubiquinone/menaquinone biosynthesis C-methylase UbiE